MAVNVTLYSPGVRSERGVQLKTDETECSAYGCTVPNDAPLGRLPAVSVTDWKGSVALTMKLIVLPAVMVKGLDGTDRTGRVVNV